MGGSIRVWRRIRVGRGATVNVSRGGVSVSVGTVGRRVTLGKQGLSVSLGLPGTGVSYRWTLSWRLLVAKVQAWVNRQPEVGVEHDSAGERPQRKPSRSRARR